MRCWPCFRKEKGTRPIQQPAVQSQAQNCSHDPSEEVPRESGDEGNQSVSPGDKYGIKVLHDPPDGTAVVDIVFVHGLTGDREETWTAGTARDPWPKSFLPTVISNARIVAFGYDADIMHFSKPVGQNSIGAHAGDLVAHLANKRDTTDSSHRPIIFVVHSLGGLICEDALLSSKNSVEPYLQNILECTRAIAFFGTPHAGSDLTRFAFTLTNLARLIMKNPNDNLLGVLERGSEVLARIQGEFHKMVRARKDAGKPDINIHCYVEQLPVEGLGKLVVPPESAILSSYSSSTIHSNHMNMTKFGRGDSGFTLVSGDLLRWVKDLGTLNFTPDEKECLDSLSFSGIDFRRNDIIEACNQTCDWLFDQQEYCTWLNRMDLDDHKALLWIKGKPGAGKSTLMKHALKQAEERFQQGIVVWFFFNARGSDDLDKTPLGLFRSLLHQLLLKSPSLRRQFLPRFRSKRLMQGKELKWHPKELQESLSSAIESLQSRRVLIFVDALDECEEQSARELVQYFEKLASAALIAGSFLNICVSSRHYPNMPLGRYQELNVGHQNYPDILTYVRVKLQGNLSDEDYSLENEVAERASGVFLWAVLAVEMLKRAEENGDTLMHKREKLQKVPAKLDETFRRILESIDVDDFPETLRMMQCVLLADRLLTPRDLCYLVAFGAEQEDDQISKLVTGDRQMERFIRSRSGGLIEIKPHPYGEAVVQFIHESVRNFLVEDFQSRFEGPDPIGKGYDLLKRSCLNYIKTKALCFQPLSDKPNGLDDRFLHYATGSVFHYAGKAEAKGISQTHLVDFLLSPTDHIFQFWGAIFNAVYPLEPGGLPSQGWTLVHVASRYNLRSCLVALLEHRADVNAKDVLGRTALHIAAYNGHCEMAQRLLGYGARSEEGDEFGQTPLALAAAHADEPLVLLLLGQYCVDSMSKNGSGQIALICATSGLVQIRRDFWMSQTLPGATAVLNLLLGNGFDINEKGKKERTTLHHASLCTNETMMRQLLDHGADTSARDEYGMTALLLAADLCNGKAVEMLLRNGADITAKDNEGRTALHLATCPAHMGAGPPPLKRNGMEVKYIYAQHGDRRRLLKKRAGLATNDNKIVVIHNGHPHEEIWREATLQLLLDNGADITSQDNSGRTVLHEATRIGHMAMRQLIENGADVTAKDNNGRTVLHEAVEHGSKKNIRLLLEKGVDITAKDNNGRTVLHEAVKYRSKKIVQLLEKGLDITAKDGNGQTLLHEAAAREDQENSIVQLLLQKGVNIRERDKQGQTALHKAAMQGHVETVRLLLENGADATEEDNDGQTALSRAAQNGDDRLARFLTPSTTC